MLFFSIFALLAMVTSAQSAENGELDFAFKPKPTVTITFYSDAADIKSIEAKLKKDGKDYTETIYAQWLCGAITGTGDKYCCVRKNCRDARTQATYDDEARRIMNKLEAIHQKQQKAALPQAAKISQQAEEQKK